MERSWRNFSGATTGGEIRAVAKAGPADLEILDVASTPRGTIVAVQALAGEPSAGLRLRGAGPADLWEVRGVGFVPAAAAAAGRWALLVAPVGHDRELRVGEHLVAA